MSMLGKYVTYKDKTYLVIKEFDDNDKVQLLNPLEVRPQAQKVCVKQSNVTLLPIPPATMVYHNNTDYMVTKKGLIVSMVTGKVMQWQENNGDRVAILKASNQFITMTNN